MSGPAALPWEEAAGQSQVTPWEEAQGGEQIQPRGHHIVGPDQYLSDPARRVGERVAANLRPLGHPMEFLRGVGQSVRDYQAQRNPNEGSWLTRGARVLGGGIVDTASDYLHNPEHILGDIATGAIVGGATGEPEIQPRAATGATEGIPWGTGGKGPLALRGRMIPQPEPEVLPPPSIRRTPGQVPPEAIRPRAYPARIASPIPSRSGLMLAGEVAEPESDVDMAMNRAGAASPEAEQAAIREATLRNMRSQVENAPTTGERMRAVRTLRDYESPVDVAERPPESVEALKSRKSAQPRVSIAPPSAPADLDLRMGEMLDQVSKEPPTAEAGPSAAERAQAKLGPPKKGTRIPGPNEDLGPLLKRSLTKVQSEKPN